MEDRQVSPICQQVATEQEPSTQQVVRMRVALAIGAQAGELQPSAEWLELYLEFADAAIAAHLEALETIELPRSIFAMQDDEHIRRNTAAFHACIRSLKGGAQ